MIKIRRGETWFADFILDMAPFQNRCYVQEGAFELFPCGNIIVLNNVPHHSLLPIITKLLKDFVFLFVLGESLSCSEKNTQFGGKHNKNQDGEVTWCEEVACLTRQNI